MISQTTCSYMNSNFVTHIFFLFLNKSQSLSPKELIINYTGVETYVLHRYMTWGNNAGTISSLFFFYQAYCWNAQLVCCYSLILFRCKVSYYMNSISNIICSEWKLIRLPCRYPLVFTYDRILMRKRLQKDVVAYPLVGIVRKFLYTICREKVHIIYWR